MDGTKTGKALGYKPIKLGNNEYDTKLNMGATREYIKFIKNIGLRIRHANDKEDIDRIVELSDEILDYKINFVKKALVLGGMSEEKAEEIVDAHVADVIRDGSIELWLEFISDNDMKKHEEVKN